MWQAQSVRMILKNPTYRGEIKRGRVTMLDKGGAITRISARPEDVRRYPRPELKVWDEETIARIDAQMQARARRTTWSTNNTIRRHLSSSFVKCGVCGFGVSITTSGRSKYAAYACTRARSKACEGIGYRAEHIADTAVIRACKSRVEPDVLEETLAIARETLDVRRQVDARALEHDRLKRDIARTPDGWELNAHVSRVFVFGKADGSHQGDRPDASTTGNPGTAGAPGTTGVTGTTGHTGTADVSTTTPATPTKPIAP